MINLLPPQIKEQVTFAKRNAVVIHYLKMVVLLMALLGIGFGATYMYLNRQIASVDSSLEDKAVAIDGFKDTQAKAKVLNQRVAAIKAIQQSQPRFSQLLDDIAKFTLKGTSITGIALTGEDNKPVRISALAPSYNVAVSLRDALASSTRVSGADIESIADQGGIFKVDIVIGFKPGMAR